MAKAVFIFVFLSPFAEANGNLTKLFKHKIAVGEKTTKRKTMPKILKSLVTPILPTTMNDAMPVPPAAEPKAGQMTNHLVANSQS